MKGNNFGGRNSGGGPYGGEYSYLNIIQALGRNSIIFHDYSLIPGGYGSGNSGGGYGSRRY